MKRSEECSLTPADFTAGVEMGDGEDRAANGEEDRISVIYNFLYEKRSNIHAADVHSVAVQS
tara:strand:+ start:932 stop:1117 length:186 start_codon:yes stop_codon:yes gene_type:complete